MKLNRTENALVGMGISIEKAVELFQKGYRVKNLKILTNDELLILGLNIENIKILRGKGRPKIPFDTVTKLLYESKSTCCVCRDDSKATIIHHIIEWSKSHSNNEDNLIVLCLHHHDEAHTKRELTQNLTPDKLREYKRIWIESNLNEKSREVQEIIDKNQTACWDLFNYFRIVEMINENNIILKNTELRKNLYDRGYLDSYGFLLNEEKWPEYRKGRSHWLNFYEGQYLSRYIKSLFINILDSKPIKILNYLWDKTSIKHVLKPGDIVFLQGAFFYKDDNKKNNRVGYRKARGIMLEFRYDEYYCTSVSAWADHMAGHKISTFFGIVRAIENDGENIVIRCSSLAVGSGFYTPFSAMRPAIAYEFDEEGYDELDFDE